MSIKPRFTLLLATLLLLCMGCRDYDGGLADRVANGSPRFDFSTTRLVNISIDYGKMAASSNISLYLNDPLSNATEASSEPEGESVFSAYLDQEGRYEGHILLPSYASQVFAYSSAWNAPMLVSSSIKQGSLSFHAHIGSPYSESSSITRAGSGEEPEKLVVTQLTSGQYTGADNNYYTINGGWDGYGKYTSDLNGLFSTGDITVDQINGLQYMLWGNSTSKPSGKFEQINNARFILPESTNPNLYIVDEYEKDGQMHKTKDAAVFFTFLSEAAWNENSVGYYFYPKGKRPKTFAEMKKYIIIPNASISHHPPFGNIANSYNMFPNDNAPVGINTRVQLLYVDDEGKVNRNFPPGIEIGFFVMVNAFYSGSSAFAGDEIVYSVDSEGKESKRYTSRSKGRINTNANSWKSDREFNSDNAHHYIVLKLQSDGTLIYGVEDGSDVSYEDILFTITATPNEVMDTEVEMPNDNIVNPELPEDKKDKTSNNYHTYAFEDMWPDGGDYDINDAVIRHKQTLTYSAMNYAKKVVDEFTFVQIPDVNTAYRDGFAIQLPENHIEGLELPDGAEYEKETNSIILTKDVRNLYGKTIKLTRTFTKAIVQGDIHDEDLNPYIINMTKGPVYTNNNRVEIHLPGHATTSKGLPTSESASPWYISPDGKYPYGLMFPDFTFEPTAEGQQIDKKYPKYNSWVESGGTKDTDWYKTK